MFGRVCREARSVGRDGLAAYPTPTAIMPKITQNTKTMTKAVATIDFNNLPDLAKATPEPVEMSGEYWTPEEVGESRRLFFFGLNIENVVDMESGETRELPVVQFVEGDGKGGVRSVRNGSRRLVGIFESFAQSIKQGDAFEIVYLGKKKNKNNSFKSDNWSVKRLNLS